MSVPAKLPVKNSDQPLAPPSNWPEPMQRLRREIDRIFDEFDGSGWRAPFRNSLFDIRPSWPRFASWVAAPAIDVVETPQAYEVTAELPGVEDKDIDVSMSNGFLVIKGEKRKEHEENKKGYYSHERQYGSFERRFAVPEGIDTAKIEAVFKKGVLTITLPKTAEAIKAEKKIAVKAA